MKDKKLYRYLDLNYAKEIENSIEQALEFKFGKFDWLRVQHSAGNIKIEFYKEGITEKEIFEFLEEIKSPNN